MLTRTAAALSLVIAVGIAGTSSVASPAAPPPSKEQVERGKALVWSIACNDCHTPKKMGPRGPELDESRLLSGHRETPVLPPPPALPPGPWGIVTNLELTAWSGPWGVTYTANLTPDPETGLGLWTEQNFIRALRLGRHMGASRPIQPPMPWEVYGRLSDDDLKAIFAYLRSIPPVKNKVPEPIIAEPPAGAQN